MIKGMAAEDSDQALDRLRGPGFAIWFPLDEVDLGGSQCVDRDGAQLGHSAPRVTAAKPTASASANLIMP
jgi:hypothetical protein